MLTSKSYGHECSFKKMWPQCNKKHKGLLHEERNENKQAKYGKKDLHKKSFVATTSDEPVVCATAHDGNIISTLLATALIRIKTKYGWSENIRALIDHGSVASFITERAAKQLNLKQNSNYINISGIAGSTETAKSIVDLQLTARYPMSLRSNVTAIVMSKLTAFLPTKDFDKSMMQTNELNVLTLADPNSNESARIDMILGADVYTELILEGMIKAHDNSYVAQETEIGWIVSGPIKKQRAKSAVCLTASINEIDFQGVK